MPRRNYRDPLHNMISLDDSVPEDALLIELRHRRVSEAPSHQATWLAMFTYQGAAHSRFAHSLGVMHLMTRALDLLSSHHGSRAKPEWASGALPHDVGHGPFSHVIENVFSFITRTGAGDCRRPETEVNQTFAASTAASGQDSRALQPHLPPAFVSPSRNSITITPAAGQPDDRRKIRDLRSGMGAACSQGR